MGLIARPVWTVGELTRLVKELLWREPALRQLAVRGELSNFKRHSSGHLYFTLKDETAAVRAVMFRSHAAALSFKPQDGMRVVTHGHISVYERDGLYQLYAERLEPDGLGALHLALERLRQRLAAEGLFAPERKRPLPRIPRGVGVVTSLTGAAVRDIITVSRRRWPGVRLVLVDVAVQGVEAPARIVQGLELIARVPGVDVVITGRGGGSIEELWAFNDEAVVRAIAACPLPVVAAVGHETDCTLADLVADVRAPTPSAAAELVVPDRGELERSLGQYQARMRQALRRQTERARSRLERAVASPALERPLDRLHQLWQRVDDLERRLGLGYGRRLDQARSRLSAVAGRLDALSPLAVLERGYSLCRNARGQVVRSVDAVRPGDCLEVLLSDGSVDCEVRSTRSRAQTGGGGGG